MHLRLLYLWALLLGILFIAGLLHDGSRCVGHTWSGMFALTSVSMVLVRSLRRMNVYLNPTSLLRVSVIPIRPGLNGTTLQPLPAVVGSATYGTTDQVLRSNGVSSTVDDASNLTYDPASRSTSDLDCA